MIASNRFTWRLQERMHERGIHQITALQRELVAHGIDLSSSQIHRLVTQTPERLNLEVFSALCEILVCSPADLLECNRFDFHRCQSARSREDVRVEPPSFEWECMSESSTRSAPADRGQRRHLRQS